MIYCHSKSLIKTSLRQLKNIYIWKCNITIALSWWACPPRFYALIYIGENFENHWEGVADPSENLWDDLIKSWQNQYLNTGLIVIWGVSNWVLEKLNKIAYDAVHFYSFDSVTYSTYNLLDHWKKYISVIFNGEY